MISEVLTEQEDQLIEQVKLQFYYPQNSGVYQGVFALLNKLPQEDQTELLRIALGQLGHEQTLRRQYVLGSLYTNYDLLSKTKQENLVIKIADSAVGAMPPNPSLNEPYDISIVGSVSQPVLEQAQVFRAVEAQLDYFSSIRNLTSSVQAMYRSLKKLPVEEVEKLRSTVQQIIADLAKQGENIFSLNPEISAPIIIQLKKVGLELSIAKYKSLGEKLRFLGLILLITSVITQASAQSLSLSEDQELLSIGRLMTAQGLRFEETQ